ncbi:MAG: glycosyltransferase family A protein [Candidatus Magasanikbacteria bacterium]
MDNELISVIIPVYNHAHTLERCLCSVASQTHRPLEVIVVNDGSTDNFSRVYKNIKLSLNIKLINQENKGAPAARNRGFKESHGDYIIFWDADVVAKPDMLAKMLAALKNNSQVSYAYSQFQFGWKKIKSNFFDADLLKRVNYIMCTSLIKRVDCPVWDELLKRFQDWDLWLTMLEQNKTGVFVPEVLFKAIVGGRVGISNWLPSFMYKLPWKTKSVKRYEVARETILRKHHLLK